MSNDSSIRLLALAIGGTILGFVAWPGTAWGGALSVLLPFACGLQSKRLHAVAVASGYYLGALGTYAAAGFLSTEGIGAWLGLAETALVTILSAIAWGLAAGHFQSAFRRFFALLGAWFVTLLSPIGAWGLAHPSLGWVFIGKGGMGVLTFVIAGLLTSFLITAVWEERRRGTALEATSAKLLSIAICTTLILGGCFDQTVTPRHHGPVAALTTNWDQTDLGHTSSQEYRVQRLEVLLQRLESLNREHRPIRLVVTGQRALQVQTPAERDAIIRRLRAAVRRNGIGLVLNIAVKEPRHPTAIASHDCVALFPTSLASTARFQSRSCSVDVIPMKTCEDSIGDCAMDGHHSNPLRLQVRQGANEGIYPALLLMSAIREADEMAQMLVLSSSAGTMLLTLQRRVETKHLNAVAWSTRIGFIAAVGPIS